MQCAEGSGERGGQCTGNVHVFVRGIAQASRVFLDNCTLTSGPGITLSPIKYHLYHNLRFKLLVEYLESKLILLV